MDENNEPLAIDEKSKALIEKWNRQAEEIKKKHPQWGKAKIEKAMKKNIIADAEAAISSKDVEEYLDEMKGIVKKFEDARERALEGIMIYMGNTSPEAVATAIFELDCGCIRACAVSNEGAPVGDMIMVSGRPVPEDYECGICQKDGGADTDRCVNKAIIWPGKSDELPPDSFRLEIGKKVFGDDYTMDDI